MRLRDTSGAWRALAAYTAIAIAATWPLARGLGRDVAWDLGDSLLNMWIVAWDAEQLLAILRGDFSRVSTFFDGNIFHPAPLTIAYSEHLFAQAVQVLPVYAISRNPILCYNLLFISTFALSGLGTYLLVKELTGRPLAAFLAGLFFAFSPYRFPQSPHIQVLSSQWMPFVVYGFRRYFAAVDEGRRGVRPLAGAAAAHVAQNLSCGYYLLYFSPFVALYVLWEIAQRGRWRQWKTWAALSASAMVVFAATLPFLIPYAEVTGRMQFQRARGEVVRYSADVHSYATASSEQILWGAGLRAFPKPEGDLFLGFVPLILAVVGVLGWRAASQPDDAAVRRPARAWLVPLLAIGSLLHLAAAFAALVDRRIVLDLWLFEIRISNVNQMLFRAGVLAALILVASPAARARARAFARDPGFFLFALLLAMWLSLGPVPQALGRPVEIAAPYAVLYEYVPGFAGVRVPARFAMIAALMLAVLSGYGAAALSRWRQARAIVAMLAVAFLAESLVRPFIVNGTTPPPGFNTPEPRVYRPARAPNVYKEFARSAPAGVLVELPLGEPDFDLRAVFYSTVHWRPLVNGYSGYYPPHYGRLALALSDVPRFPDGALAALREFGTTHVIVHEGAYLGDRGVTTSTALRNMGATEAYREGTDVLLALP